jgi:hypothetical protein
LAPSEQEIRDQLALIMASPLFHGSRRGQQFLEYVCNRALAGDFEALKERTLAVEIFGRDPHADLTEDSIVRVGAREVRKRLAQYYVSSEGAVAPIRIDLPAGSYAPDFQYHATPFQATPHSNAPETVAAKPKWRTMGLAVLGILLLVGAGYEFTTRPTQNERAFADFWSPVLDAKDPLLVAVAHPIVYHPSPKAVALSENGDAAQHAIQVPADQLDGSDLIPVFNQYVGFGDLVVASQVSAMLATRGHDARLRMASAVDFAELRSTPTLLVGAVTNRWTMEAQKAWRFRFVRVQTPKARTLIQDTQDPARSWAVEAKADGSADEDYLLLCRTRDPETGGVLLAAAGLKQFGTEAAGRLLADPEQLGPILAKLDPLWATKNVQIVLHARVIGNTPTQPEVVAAHVW